jgi:predicted TIM-barrel fold metal-dependent hydrolase
VLTRFAICGILLALTTSALAQAPAADYHTHLASPRAAELLNRAAPPNDANLPEQPKTAADLIVVLDAAHIPQAVAVSDAYRFGAPWVRIPNEAAEAERENAWTAAQAALYPRRLVAFCSVNPLKSYALATVRRCHRQGLHGLKLHLANAGFRLDRPADRQHLIAVFRLANPLRMPILIHLRGAEQWDGAQAAELFYRELLPAAPDTPVQLAHLGGWGGYDRTTDATLSTLLDRCAANPAPCARLYFDLAAVLLPSSASQAPVGSDERMLADAQAGFAEGPARLLTNLRRIPAGHLLFATDWPVATPTEDLDLLRTRLQLTPAELDRILAARAPYLP